MNDTRRIFLESVETSRAVLGAPQVAARWEAPSVLPEFTVRGLAGHLARATLLVVDYLNQPVPEARPIPAAAYFARAVTSSDPGAPQNVMVRERGEAEAVGGHAALLRRLDEASGRLRTLLASESPDRLLRAANGLVLRLDDYLLTRVVEIVVHVDDLALSVGIAPPAWPPAVIGAAIDHLVDVARFRHGDLAVLRALARRERDAAQALRVF